ncbi:hypothetical protein [Dehalobacter sp.]|uniref:hypothetical protein n=1 Tax=Dehalobacter sp. TaxID=1962289 RepID=UPI002582559F|nr:hypothetical protein [Dehalobacter sp.]MDJ0305587.1 hypothetical protein [Dehalobacter sp.]
MPKYQVAGLVIHMDESTPAELFEGLIDYNVSEPQAADLCFTYQTSEQIDLPQGENFSDESSGYKCIKKPNAAGFYFYTRKYGSVGEILVLLDIDAAWRNVGLTCAAIQEKNELEESYVRMKLRHTAFTLMGIVFRHALLKQQGLVIHASAIKWQDKAIMFTAPSGTGKSTQSRLWQEHKENVLVLNDDNPAVRIMEDHVIVYGTPWSGSSNINTNDSAPLSAVIILEQAAENSIRRMDLREAIIQFMPRAFLPFFDQEHMNEAMRIFEKIVSSVPVYLLRCRPDQEAVELVYQCIK